jgi:putative transposase
MSVPRRVLPGETYLLTRRCSQRTFRLRPSELTNRIFLYALALAAEKTGVLVHAVCVMSNHHHMVVTDVRGVLPDFLRELHRTIAKVLNASQGQWESLWSSEATNVVRLGDGEDAVRKIAYVVTNPVDAGLVAAPGEWPGVNLWGEHELRVERPDEYFDAAGKAPSVLVLRVQPPTRLWAGDTSFCRRLAATIEARIGAASRTVKAAGLTFVGRAGVLATSFVARARSYEVNRVVVPTVAAADPDVRKALLRQRQSFLVEYYEALKIWCGGVREVVFPEGTWWLRVHHGAAVAGGAARAIAPG